MGYSLRDIPAHIRAGVEAEPSFTITYADGSQTRIVRYADGTEHAMQRATRYDTWGPRTQVEIDGEVWS